MAQASEPGPGRPDEEVPREAVVDLLGVLAYGELTAFERLAADAGLAPTLADEDALAAMAVAEFAHYRVLRARLTELGADPDGAMAPFVRPLSAFHDSTRPSDWLEGLVKAYVGDGIGSDFYREVAQFVDPSTRSLVFDVLADAGQSAFAVSRVRAAVAADPVVAGRLALWARRLVGEALTQAQRVAAERDALAGLLIGGNVDLVEVGNLLERLTDAHSQRMAALGLSGGAARGHPLRLVRRARRGPRAGSRVRRHLPPRPRARRRPRPGTGR